MMQTHRVGTITTGIVLVAFGILFLLHLFGVPLSYETIFRLWPVILIGLGLETLVSKVKVGAEMVYDKGAIFLVIVMSFFAMCMAGAEWFMTNCQF